MTQQAYEILIQSRQFHESRSKLLFLKPFYQQGSLTLVDITGFLLNEVQFTLNTGPWDLSLLEDKE